MKKLLTFYLLILSVLVVESQDINPGQTFTDGQRLTAAQLSQLVSLATINPTFYTRQVSQGIPASGDTFLCYSASGLVLHKLTAASLLYQNYDLFRLQTAYANPASYSTLLFYDPSNVYFGQLTLSNLASFVVNQGIYTNNFLPQVNQQIFTPYSFYATNSSTNYWHQTTVFNVTNLFMFGTNNVQTLTNNDTVPVFSTLQNTNTTTTLYALWQYMTSMFQLQGTTNKLTATSSTGGTTNLDYTTYFQINSETNINSGTSNVATFAPNWFTSSEFTVANATYSSNGVAHTLNAVPRFVRWVLVCKTADSQFNYPVGTEIDVSTTFESTANQPHAMYGATSNTVFCMVGPLNSWLLRKSNDGTIAALLTPSNWKLKCYYAK